MEAIRRQEETNRLADQPEIGEGVSVEASPVPSAWSLDGSRVVLRVDLSVYSLKAVLRACYKLTDRCYVFMSRARDAPSQLLAALTPKAEATPLTPIVGELMNELLDQQIRQSLDSEFGSLRTLIVAQAFAEGNLLNDGTDDASSGPAR